MPRKVFLSLRGCPTRALSDCGTLRGVAYTQTNNRHRRGWV